ncbi:30S ribosomal protein S12 methylthiotransferase RimO [Succinispira mobilis]|uniref:30S ribosomal protein S12 methylthiotransferase RimO n=1 Tax=Succinispira mobilis TaxID=78120 RepID=UPI00036CC881|nr:30S ribosomal protein S12 methylthiotransferase RimO [Succinispira mobilis]
MSLKVGLVSLGCPKNLVDSENMLGFINASKYEITPHPEDADVIIINTCAFIESAKEESITTILQMAQYKQEKCKAIIVAGCMVERYAESLLEEIPEIDAVVGVNDWQKIIEVIEQLDLAVEKQAQIVCTNSEQLALYSSAMPRLLTTPKHFAYVKIAEGCDNACSYCIIPRIRGEYRSRDKADILKEVTSLVEKGVREVILIAQDVTRYGEDLYGKLTLPELLSDLNAIEELKWIRLMYLYPQSFTDELIETMANLPKVLKYIDIPLQHISNKVLADMNRQDSKESISCLIDKIRAKIPNVCIRTAFIVGFPGETEQDFLELCDFVETYNFDNVGIFTYSQEEDTVAAEMPNQVDDFVKQERYHQLMSIQAKISEFKNQTLETAEIEVVIEGFDLEDKTVALARSYREAPEIDGCVYVENASGYQVGDFLQVEVLQGFTYEIVAEPKVK